MVGGGGDNDSGTPNQQQQDQPTGCTMIAVDTDVKEQDLVVVAKTTPNSNGHHHEAENENTASFSETSPRRAANATYGGKSSVPLSLIDGKPNTPLISGQQQQQQLENNVGDAQQAELLQQQQQPEPREGSPSSGSSSSSPPDQQHPQRQHHAVYSRSFPSVGLLSIASTLSEDSILHEQPGQVPSDEEVDSLSSPTAGDASGAIAVLSSSQGGVREEEKNATTKTPGEGAVVATQLDTGVLRSWKQDSQARDIFRAGSQQEDGDDDEYPDDEGEHKRSPVSRKSQGSRKSAGSRGSSARQQPSVRSRFVSSIKAGLGSVLSRGATPPLVPKKSTDHPPPVAVQKDKSPSETASNGQEPPPPVDGAEEEKRPSETTNKEQQDPPIDGKAEKISVEMEQQQESSAAVAVVASSSPRETAASVDDQQSSIDGAGEGKCPRGTASISREEDELVTSSSIDGVTVENDMVRGQDVVVDQQATEIASPEVLQESTPKEDAAPPEGPQATKEPSAVAESDTVQEAEASVESPDNEITPPSESSATTGEKVLEPTPVVSLERAEQKDTLLATAAEEDDKALPSLTKSCEGEYSSTDSSEDIEIYNPVISGSSSSGETDAMEAAQKRKSPTVSTCSVPDGERAVSAATDRTSLCSTKDEYEWAYYVWIRKGLLSEEAMADKLSKKSTPCIDEELDKKLRKRRESVDAQIAGNVQKAKPRKSMPALPVSTTAHKAGYRRCGGKDFANVLSQWKTKTAGRHDVEELNDDSQNRLQQPFKTVTNPVNNITTTTAAVGDQAHEEKISRAEPKKNKASSNPIPNLKSDRSLSPVRSAPRSQAWKLKMETEKRVAARRSKRNVPTPPGSLANCTKSTVNNSGSRAQSAPRYQQELVHACSSSNGRPPSTGRSSRLSDRDRPRPQRRRASSRASSGGDSPVQPDKYTPRAQSLSRRKRAPSPLPSGVPATISISTPTKAPCSAPGSTVETESNTNTPKKSLPEVSMMRIADLAMMSNMDQRFTEDQVQRDRSDSSSSVANSIPKEVNVSAKKLMRLSSSKPGDGDANVTSHSELVEKHLEEVYNSAEAVRSPNNACAERPWRRDSLLARVTKPSTVKAASECHCVCSDSVFSGNDAMIDFFLPLMGAACTCGKKHPGLISPEEPTSLVNILRPWQVAFLRSCGIYRGDELVKVNHRNGNALASVMRQYRKDRGMAPFRTKSCGMALQIWSKTSKAFVRSIRSQMKAAENQQGEGVQLEQAREIRLPNALYIVSAFLDNIPSDCISQGPDSTAHSASDSGTSVASSISISRSSFDMTEPQIEESAAGRSLILRSGRQCEAEI